MARLALVLFALFSVVASTLNGAAAGGRDLKGADGYNYVCEVFSGGVGGKPTALYNPNFSSFQSLLGNVLGWGGRFLQTSWCGSGGLHATILAPNNKAMTAGFKELHKRYKIQANPLKYSDNSPFQSGDGTPLFVAIDAIVEAGMIRNMLIDFEADKRIPSVEVAHGAVSKKYFAVHSSISNINPSQVLHFWRNTRDGCIYVYLPGGIMPGPYRVLVHTKRHVTFCAKCTPTESVYVYEIDGLLVPGNVVLGLSSSPPYKVKALAPILRSIGPNGNHVVFKRA